MVFFFRIIETFETDTISLVDHSNIVYGQSCLVFYHLMANIIIFLTSGKVRSLGSNMVTVCDYGSADGASSVPIIKACRGTDYSPWKT